MGLDEIKKALSILVKPGDVVELRILNTGKTGTISGYYNDMYKLADAALKYSGTVPAIYITINPVDDSLLARANNRVLTNVKMTTNDSNVTKRRWLPIDIDFDRPAGISSSNSEHNAAHIKALEIKNWLADRGWPAPVYGDSGNGAHLLYRIDLPNSSESDELIKTCLSSLASVHNNGKIHIDEIVFNAARIWKLYNTMVCKGENLPGRPHRLSKIIESPTNLELVTVEQLKSLATLLPKPALSEQTRNSKYFQKNKFDIEGWMRKHKLAVKNIIPEKNRMIYVLAECPFNSEHKDASITQFTNGALAFNCFHNSCKYNTWKELRGKLDPRKKQDKPFQKPLEKVIGIFKDNLELAIEMQKLYPVYFDNSLNFWFWLDGGYHLIDETDIAVVVKNWIGMHSVINSRVKNEIIEAIKVTGRERVVKEPEKHWVHLRDCVVDLRYMKRFKSTPDYLFTKPIPHNIGESTHTPIIDKLFVEWVGDKKAILYEICAYCLYNAYPIHRVFCLYGKGRNGKGQFLQLLEKFLGKENTTSSDLERIIDSRFEAAKLYKKLAVFIGETNFNVLRNTSYFKRLTGEDLINGEYKHKNPFDFTNNAKLIIATNSLPMTDDRTEGFYSRWNIIEFTNQFDEGVNIVETIPEHEFENLVAKCIQILPELIKRGKFTNEGTILDREKNYERISNPVSQFIELRCIKDTQSKMALWQLYEAFERFQDEKGYRKISRKEFTSILRDRGYETKDHYWFGNSQWTAIFGIKIKDFNRNSVMDVLQNDGTNIVANGNETSSPLIANVPNVPNVPNVQQSCNSSSYRELYETNGTYRTCRTDAIEKAGREWEQIKGKPINSTTITEFCLWYCEQSDNGVKPSEIKELATKIFKLTPDNNTNEQEQKVILQIHDLLAEHYGSQKPSPAGYELELKEIQARFNLDEPTAKKYINAVKVALGW